MKITRLPTWALMACAAVPLQSLSQTVQRSTPGAPSALAPAQSLPDGSPVFPDRRPGNPQAEITPPPLQLGNYRVGTRELGYQSSESTRRLDWRVQYGRGEGMGVGVNYARLLNDQWAWGVNGNAGSGHLDLVVNGLYSLTPQWHVGGSLGYLDRTDTYNFFTGPGEASASQFSHRLSVQRAFDKDQVLSDLGVQVTSFSGGEITYRTSSPALLSLDAGSAVGTLARPREWESWGRVNGLPLNLEVVQAETANYLGQTIRIPNAIAVYSPTEGDFIKRPWRIPNGMTHPGAVLMPDGSYWLPEGATTCPN